MRLQKVELINFRCFVNEPIDLSSYTAVVGPNNCGKSTIFKGIDLFFRSTQRSSPITRSDFGDANKELRISLTFSDLPAAAIDEFQHYYRHGKLEFFIKAHLDDRGLIHSSVHGRRSGIANFGGFFAASGAAAQKAAYGAIRENGFLDLPEIPIKTALGVFEQALREYEAAHLDQHKMIESEDLAFGAGGVAARLKKYVDWVYIPAVKDAGDEDEEAKNTAFGALIARIIRAKVKVEEKVASIRAVAHETIKTLVGDYREEIAKLESTIDTEFRKITSTDAHVHLDWTEMDESSVSLNLPLVRSRFSDETFKGDISEFGHGLQRNYLITLVHLTAKMALEGEPSLILACEEPELYQHPPQARYLHTALLKISTVDQVLITTHSPYFISARIFENIRVVRKRARELSKVSAWTVDQHRKLIAGAFGEEPIGELASQASLEPYVQPELAEAFFCGKLVLVEGPEDRAILSTALNHFGLLDDFLRSGCHIVCSNGKPGLINMVALARGFSTPYFVMFDADTGCAAGDVESTKALNAKVAKLMDLPVDEITWPEADGFGERSVIWKNDIQTSIVRDYEQWIEDVKETSTSFGGQYARLKKNPAVVSCALAKALGVGAKIPGLEKAVRVLHSFALA